MRPEPTASDSEVFECFDCGARVTDNDGRLWSDCGGTVRNLGRGRDL